jgi:hypothetical protein
LALKYQLVSEQTSLFLVYLREGEDKATGLPEVHQTPQMLAAGSHGFGSVRRRFGSAMHRFGFVSAGVSQSIVDCSLRGVHSGFAESVFSESFADFGDFAPSGAHSPQELLQYFDEQALASQDYARVLQLIQELVGSDHLQNMVADFALQEGLTPEQAWAILLDWLMARLVNDFTPSRQAKRLLRPQLKPFDQTRHAAFQSSLDGRFASVSAGAWQ